MGIELVEGPDLKVGNDEHVYMQTVEGLVRVDVIYRRVDEDFLDPEVFRKDSVLGIPGVMRSGLQARCLSLTLLVLVSPTTRRSMPSSLQ